MLEEKCQCVIFRLIAREQGRFPWNVASELFAERIEGFIFISSIEKLDVYFLFALCCFFSKGIENKKT